MEDNPFAVMVDEIRKMTGESLSARLVLGAVTSAPTEEQPNKPLRVFVSGLEKPIAALRKNAAISSFLIGDQLLMMPTADNQRYIIICKVVNV